ncbi:hypothetical protein [Brevibacillus parabrevis]|uniref:Lipoprotein n=1 Tax=Brevibacillus parabrevis TaxID=54914 RepID=A0A4Y3PM12_BREPA|nr:hypothetical protein [Brevibacillus parabrevis]RNB92193.1 hypothetical protein EDM60_26640 [Brevibacillus parabrevis]GEB33875.1 hypothetical protein BPA01_34550 [Brevibacillus parabrevis]
MKMILTALLFLFSLTACSSNNPEEELKAQSQKLILEYSKILYEVKKEDYVKTPGDFTAYIPVIQDKAKPYLTKKEEPESLLKLNIGFVAAYLAYNDIFLTVEDVKVTDFERDEASGAINISYTILFKDSLKSETKHQAGRVTLVPDDKTFKIDYYWDDVRTNQFKS